MPIQSGLMTLRAVQRSDFSSADIQTPLSRS
jgi:hypothetical protein